MHIKGELLLVPYRVGYYRQEDYVANVSLLNESFTRVEK